MTNDTRVTVRAVLLAVFVLAPAVLVATCIDRLRAWRKS